MNRIYVRNREPLHLVLEEANEFAPEQNMPGDAAMLGAVQPVVRPGRIRGRGATLISQRSAAVSIGVLTQADVMIALRTTAPHDQKAIGEWIRAKGVEDQREPALSSLASLPTGTGHPEEGALSAPSDVRLVRDPRAGPGRCPADRVRAGRPASPGAGAARSRRRSRTRCPRRQRFGGGIRS